MPSHWSGASGHRISAGGPEQEVAADTAAPASRRPPFVKVG